MAEKWILWFDKVGRQDTNLVGGKCANLGEMSKIGIPVPPGFAVTTAVYDTFLAETGKVHEINQYLTKFPGGPQNINDYEEVGRTLREMIETTEMPKKLQDAIGQAYDALCERCGVKDLPVAVRSSGVAEDMPTASFAGQYDSYLNVRGKKDVLECTKKCWASMFTARGIAYRQHNQLQVLEGSISVAVQKMVNARTAGVGFTVNPNTGDRSKIVIEGNWGVGESIVQGIVDPDIFTIDKETLCLTEARISRKLRKYVLNEQGTEEEEIPPEQQTVPCLEEQEAQKVAEIAKILETHYNLPLDIEWAVDLDFPFPDNVFLVQCRPITAIAEQKSSTDRVLDMMLARVFAHAQ